MKYQRFEELPVWQAAIDLGTRVLRMTMGRELQITSAVRDQIERAVISISNNIAEGFERGTLDELMTFLYYARGSAAEVRSMLYLLGRATDSTEAQSLFHENYELAEGISRQLGAWLESLKNHQFKGHRERNDSTRRRDEASRRSNMFLEHLNRIVESGKAERDSTNSPGPGDAEDP